MRLHLCRRSSHNADSLPSDFEWTATLKDEENTFDLFIGPEFGDS